MAGDLPSSVVADLASFIGQAIVVGLGWVVVHRLSVRRDQDKARRELIVKTADSLAGQVDDLLKGALIYHGAAQHVEADARSLKMALQDLGLNLEEVGNVHGQAANVAQCRSELGRLRRAVTRHHFEDDHDGPLPDTHPQYQEIGEAVLKLKLKLTRLRFSQFPASGK